MNDEKLIQNLLQMELPQKRIENKDWNWIMRNISIKNSFHPLFKETVAMLRKKLSVFGGRE